MTRRPILDLDDPLAPRPSVGQASVASAPAPAPKRAPTGPAGVAADWPREQAEPPAPTPVDPASATDSVNLNAPGKPELALVGETGAVSDGPWRAWAGGTRVASYRLPDELLEELDERARRLGVPIGMTVAAGVLSLLDQDDQTLIRLVERAEDARVLGRRAARRR